MRCERKEMTQTLAENESRVPLSREEDDLIMRSSKKLKNGGKNVSSNVLQDEWPKLGSKKSKYNRGGPSFVEKLKGKSGAEDSSDDENEKDCRAHTQDIMSEDDNGPDDFEPPCITEEDLSRNFPTFAFSERMKKRLHRAWRKAVIVKLLDKSIGYKALLSRLQHLWAKKGVINLINIGHGFYVVKLSNIEDYIHALTGGPWMIYDHYLTVRPWEPNFVPARVRTNKVAVWVRMPNVFLEYYDREALTIIGNRIGETLKIDINTSSQLRGHYACICVLVDLEKQLMSGFRLDEEDYFLEYKCLHLLCHSCGIYGHAGEACPSRKQKHSEGTGTHAGEGQAQSIPGNPITNENPNSYRDQWKTVQKNRRPQRVKESKEGTQKQNVQGYGILVDAEEQHEQETTKAVVPGIVVQKVVGQQFVKQSMSVKARKGAEKGAQSRQTKISVDREEHTEQTDEFAYERRKRVEKRARERKSGELLMLIFRDDKSVDISTESPSGVCMDEANDSLQEKKGPERRIGMVEAQEDLLDPGEQADVNMGQQESNLVPIVGDQSLNEEGGSWDVCSLIPETQLSI